MLINLLSVSKTSELPIFRQITLQITELIRGGVIRPGYQLPGSRKLATELNVHRKTVVAALDQLILEGWLETIAGKGTFVAQQLPDTPRQLRIGASGPSLAPVLQIPESLKRELPLTTQLYHLDDGLPDPRLAPITELARAYKSSLTQGNLYSKYTYGDTRGHDYLRKVLDSYLLETRGINVHKDRILITRGVTQALYLCIQAFLAKGDQVAVGELNWESANANFLYHGMQLIRVKVDAEGLDTDHLEELLQTHTIRMLYITPHHQYPTTVIMPAARRLRLIRLALQYGFYIFEDDYDYDFHYTAHPVMPLASTDHGDFVLYAGSFTKAISPVFRVGYLVASASQIDYLSRVRRMVDRQGDALLELAIAELLELGIIQRYLRKNRKIYDARRTHFATLLNTQLADRVTFRLPPGGMSFWTHFAPDINLPALAKKALQQDLFITAGTQVSASGPINATRLGFASSNETELEKSVAILKSLL